VLLALEDARRRFDLPLDAFEDLIDGVETDARDEVFYDTFEQLLGYCRQVAGSIGRLAVAVLGVRDRETAMSLADDLGVALQLTNILRDLIEDRERRRVYLPREDLARFGCPPDPLAAPTESLAAVIREEAWRNRQWYSKGRPLVALLDPHGAACIMAMAGVYERILDRIELAPNQVLRGTIRLTSVEKAAVASAAFATLQPSDQAA
jgi:15-cis-phytoene synthase